MEEEEDLHVCLVCNRTISGLLNYVHHKKHVCRKAQKVDSDLQHSSYPSITATASFSNQPFDLHQNAYLGNDQQTYSFRSSPTNTSSLKSSLLMTSSDLTCHQTLDTPFHKVSEDLQNLASKTVPTLRDKNFLSDPVSISTYNTTVNSGNPSTSLSPMFSTDDNNLVKVGDIATASTQENYGLLNATINRINQNLFVPDSRYEENKSDTSNIHNIQETDHTMQNDTTSNILTGKDDGTDNGKSMTEEVDDFFQSLELMSRAKVEKVGGYHQLPISSILNNLNFSSDEDDIGFHFGDDVSLDSLSEDSDNGGVHARVHTGGKWRPGEKPQMYRRHRSNLRGKWPPGQMPLNIHDKSSSVCRGGKKISLIRSMILNTVASTNPRRKTKKRKNVMKKSGTSSTKTYSCNFCNTVFVNRFQYSNHCGSKQHKEMVFGHIEPNAIDQEGSVVTRQDAVIRELKNINKEHSEAAKKSDMATIDKGDVTSQNDVEKETYYKQKDSNSVIDEPDMCNKTQTNVQNEIPVHMHICTACNRTFDNKYLIAKHLLTKMHRNRAAVNPDLHVNLVQQYNKYIVKLSPYQCAICRFFFNSNFEFEKHIKSDEHVNQCKDLIGEMQCSLCCFKTHHHSQMLLHLESGEHVTNINKGKLACVLKECHVRCQCKYCGLLIHSFARLKHHTIIKHSDGKIVSNIKKRNPGRNRPDCTECNQKFASESALGLHIRRKHTGEKPYACETCNVGFAGKNALNLHLKTSRHVKRAANVESVSFENQDVMETVQGNKLARKLMEKEIRAENDMINTVGQTYNIQNQIEADTIIEMINHDTKEVSLDITSNKKDKMDVEIVKKSNSVNSADDFEDVNDEEWLLQENTKKFKRNSRKKTLTIRKNNKGIDRLPRSNLINKAIKCKHCSVTVPKYDDLRPHYLKAHSKQIRICDICDHVLLSETALKIHILSSEHQNNIETSATNAETKNKYFECHICKKKFTDENYCKFHTAYQHFHLTTEDAVLKENCGKDVTREKYHEFLIHLANGVVSDLVKCPECGVLIKKSGMVIHLRTHTGDSPFKCKVCPSSFVSNYTLRRHLLRHFGCEDKTCSLCNKQFHKTETYEKHMQIHDAKNSNVEKLYKCEKCNQSFYFEYQLQNHVLRHQERTFACPYPGCIWKFCFKFELNCHIKTHMNVKPFLCDLCGYAGSTKHMLTRHRRTHTGERKYHCEYCTYKAGNITHLHRHMRIHIGSKPFKCPYCDYVCNTHENMSKHIQNTRKHEGLKVYPCKFCEYGTNVSAEFRKHLLENHKPNLKLGPSEKLPTLSVLTGLYRKELDLQKPEEGMQIIQVKERKSKRRTFQDDGDVDGKPEHQMDESWMHSSKKKTQKSNIDKRNKFENDIMVDSGNKNVSIDQPEKSSHQILVMNTVDKKHVYAPFCSDFQGASEQQMNGQDPSLLQTMQSIGYVMPQFLDLCLSSTMLEKTPSDACKSFPTVCVSNVFPVTLTTSSSFGTHFSENYCSTHNEIGTSLSMNTHFVGQSLDSAATLRNHDYCTKFRISHCAVQEGESNSNLSIDIK